MKLKLFLLISLANLLIASGNNFKMLQSNLISGLIPDIEDGYGAALRDFNGDGYPDLYLVCFRNMNRLLVNNGGIVPFIDRTIYSGLGGDLSSRGNSSLELGAGCADFDNDGIPDIFMAGWGKTATLFRGLGRFRFENATASLQMQGFTDANQGLWLDANNDGFLDLFITAEHHSSRLFLNEGNGLFREHLWAREFTDSATSQGAVSADFDADGDADIYLCNWGAPDYLLLNDGAGNFTKSSFPLPTLMRPTSSNSAAAADLDNDGRTDLLIAGHDGFVYFYRNQTEKGSLSFTADTLLPFYRIGKSIYGILAEDFNQDGWIDVFLSIREGANRLYLSDGRGGFLGGYDSDGQKGYSTGCAAGDIDRDGDLDIFVANKDMISQVYLNPVNGDHFIKITLTGVVSNRDAVGSKVFLYSRQDSLRTLFGFREVTVNTGYLSGKDPQVYFGTGKGRSFEAEIRFPSGRRIIRKNLHPGKTYRFSEYGSLLKVSYQLLHLLQFHSRRLGSWLTVLLFLFLIFLLFLYVRFGLRRYQWEAPVIAIQLVSWFVVSLISFIAVKKQDALIILSVVDGISVTAVLLSALYSEKQLRLRRRRTRFRSRVQSLSVRMIHIHDDETLFRDLRETILEHDDIRRVHIFVYDSGRKKLTPFSSPKKEVELSSVQEKELRRVDFISKENSEKFNAMFDALQINLLLPVKQEGGLMALIALFMDKYQASVNREDVHLLLPLANQTAIAVENNNFIRESAQLVKELTEARTKEKYVKALEETNAQLDLKNKELNRLFLELQQKEGQLIHSEKMASLGQLVAGISHELNNPISFIYANTIALEKYLKELKDLWASLRLESADIEKRFLSIAGDLQDIIHDNLNGSKSVKELVLNLKNFSRLDQAEWKESRLSEGIESSLKILKPQLTKEIQIVKDFRTDPLIFCNPGQLNQVFVNLLSNALQAVDGKGRITISMKAAAGGLEISITDTGKGIPQEIQQKIFDPFFTTKEVNKGTGLGLSISYTIIKSHNGKLTVKSKPGEGSVFTIFLPPGQKKPETAGINSKT